MAVIEATTSDSMEWALQAWAAWLNGSGNGAGFPTKSVLHESWLPPQPGMTPSMQTGGRSYRSERLLHKCIQCLSVRQQNTLAVVYVRRMPVAEQVTLLECGASTVRVRVMQAKRALSAMLAVG